jgi:hypothetical protein
MNWDWDLKELNLFDITLSQVFSNPVYKIAHSLLLYFYSVFLPSSYYHMKGGAFFGLYILLYFLKKMSCMGTGLGFVHLLHF